MTTPRKKLIEVALPLEAINAASAREKSIRHGHPSTLHLWWARRPLAACRAVIFTSLVDDPNDPAAPPEFVEACKQLPRGKNAAENDTPRQRLFDFIVLLVQWKSTTDEKVLETARELIRLATDGNPPPLLDPFAGGGSIPLEAQRLGLEAHASDLNPVAVMINKALIEIPPKFANRPPVNPRDRAGTAAGGSWRGAAGLAADVRYYGEWMREKAWEHIGHLYPKCNNETVVMWLWARSVKSPNPAVSVHVPLISTFWLSKKKTNKVWIEPIVNKHAGEFNFKVKSGKPSNPDSISSGTKAGSASFSCLISDTPITGEYIDGEANLGQMGVIPLAVITENQNGRNYFQFPQDEAKIIRLRATDYINNKIDKTKLPNAPARGTFGSNNAQGRIYGFNVFADYFSDRQLSALITFSNLLDLANEQIYTNSLQSLKKGEARDYADAICTYLAFAIDRSADYWSTLATPGDGFVRSTFARQAISMSWDYAEANPFSNSTGNWMGAIEWIAKVLDRLQPVVRGFASQMDATKIDHKSGIPISTDPPYYDNITYSDLADYFYVWMRLNLSKFYPDLFSTMLVPKSSELIANRYRFDGSMDDATQHFEDGLREAFKKMRTIIPHTYPFTVFYAFRQTDFVSDEGISSTGWETMLDGLILSKFSIVGTWPLRTERSGRSVAVGRNALASSIVLVCRPRPEDAQMTSRREFVNALRRELPAALREMQSGNIAPVDLAQASIGPGMAVYSRYSKVLEPDGSPLTVRTALQIINHELDAYLAEQEGEMDVDSRFSVAWFEQFGFDEGGFGQADVLARAKNTSVEGMVSAGVLESGAGVVRLLGWSELDPGWDPESDTRLTVWETVHHLIERLNTYGEEGAARLLAKLSPEMAADARQMAYRLYSLCERKGWAEHARDYNALVVSWGASQEQARELKEQYQQGQLL